MCEFCEDYQYRVIQAEQDQNLYLTEIGVKICIYKYRDGNRNCIPSRLISKIFPLNFCPICGQKLSEVSE